MGMIILIRTIWYWFVGTGPGTAGERAWRRAGSGGIRSAGVGRPRRRSFVLPALRNDGEVANRRRWGEVRGGRADQVRNSRHVAGIIGHLDGEVIDGLARETRDGQGLDGARRPGDRLAAHPGGRRPSSLRDRRPRVPHVVARRHSRSIV